MAPPLNYVLAREKQADLVRAAERARLAAAMRPVEANTARHGLLIRVLNELRLSRTRPQGQPAPTASEVEPLIRRSKVPRAPPHRCAE
jgi:hypothetical protein